MLSEAEVDATMAYAQAVKAAATRKAYASDWRARWCGARLAARLPAHPVPPGPGAARLQGQHHRSPGSRDRLPPQAGPPRAADQPGGRQGRAARDPADDRHGEGRKAPATADV